VGAPWYMKNCFRGQSMEWMLGNTSLCCEQMSRNTSIRSVCIYKFLFQNYLLMILFWIEGVSTLHNNIRWTNQIHADRLWSTFWCPEGLSFIAQNSDTPGLNLKVCDYAFPVW